MLRRKKKLVVLLFLRSIPLCPLSLLLAVLWKAVVFVFLRRRQRSPKLPLEVVYLADTRKKKSNKLKARNKKAVAVVCLRRRQRSPVSLLLEVSLEDSLEDAVQLADMRKP
jgi:hypothetical protein